jgi:hypothetical protein
MGVAVGSWYLRHEHVSRSGASALTRTQHLFQTGHKYPLVKAKQGWRRSLRCLFSVGRVTRIALRGNGVLLVQTIIS